MGNIEALGDKAPKDPSAQREVAKVLYELDEPARSRPFADRAVELAPDDAEARLLRAHVNESLGRYAEANADAEAALRLRPNDARAMVLLQLLKNRVSSFDVGRPKLPEPDEALARIGAGGTKASSSGEPGGKAGKAEALLRESAAKLGLGDPDAARRLAAEAAKLEPKRAQPYLQQALAQLHLGRNVDAEQSATKALEREPERLMGYLLRSVARAQSGRHRAAKEDADAVLSRDPRNAQGFYYRAVAREGLQEDPGSILEDFRRAAELDPVYAKEYEAAMARVGSKAPARKHSIRGRLVLGGLGAALCLLVLWRGRRSKAR